MRRFSQFCLVGCLGFIVDSLCFLLLERLLDNAMLVRLLSFWLAATSTWLGNNLITWCRENCTLSFVQWGRYMVFCHFSGVINLLVFWLCLGQLHTYIGFSLGIGAGLLSNYFLSSRFVFNTHNKIVDIS